MPFRVCFPRAALVSCGLTLAAVPAGASTLTIPPLGPPQPTAFATAATAGGDDSGQGAMAAEAEVDAFANEDDFQIDRAFAEADAARGTLRAFAREGGASGLLSSTGATARIADRVVITGAAGAAPQAATLSLLVDATTDTLTLETGGPVGGRTRAFILARLSADTFTRRGNSNRFDFRRAFTQVDQSSGNLFIPGSNPSIVDRVVPFENGLLTDSNIEDFGDAPNRATDTRVTVLSNTSTFFEALLEIDLLLSPGDILEIGGVLDVLASGTAGHAAAANGLNTGRLFLDLPGDLGFDSRTQGFLSRQSPFASRAPAPIPLPTTLALSGAGIIALTLAARRRRPHRD